MFSLRFYSAVGMLIAIPVTAVALRLAIGLVNRLTSRADGATSIKEIDESPGPPTDLSNPFSAPAVTTVETGSEILRTSFGWILLIAFVQNVCRGVLDAVLYGIIFAYLRHLSQSWLIMVAPFSLLLTFLVNAAVLTFMLSTTLPRAMLVALIQGLIILGFYTSLIGLMMAT